MFSAALSALKQILTPPFRAALWKTVALTVGILALVWLGLDKLLLHYAAVAPSWLSTVISILTGLGLFIGLAFLIAPVSMLVAGFFLDELAERVEREISPGAVGRALPLGSALWLAAKFACVSLLVNACALLFLLVPGVNFIAFFAANAYLFGREYFELAALRYRPLQDVRELRRRNAFYLFACGFFMAALLAIPVVNLLTPLFGVAFMVRIHARMLRRENYASLGVSN